MTFARPFLLLLLALIGYFAYLGRPTGSYGRNRAWVALVLRCLIVSCIVLGLAGVRSVQGSDQLAVVFLLDASDSISPAEQERALTFVERALEDMEPSDRAALVLFGADALVERPMTASPRLAEITSLPRSHHTDLEEAIRLGLALFPPGAARRMVILSDGRPTAGDAESAALLARAQDVELDVVRLGAPLGPEVRLAQIDLPTQLHQGEEFTLSIVVESNTQTEAELSLVSAGQAIAQQTLQLSPGRNRFALPQVAGEPGFVTYSAALAPAADTYPQNNALSAFTLIEGPPRVLIAAVEPDEARTLEESLRASGLEVDRVSPALLPPDPAGLAEYAAVILVNPPAQAISPRAMSSLQSFVRDLEGGLVAVGGPESYGVGGWYDTPLEESLPVEMTIDDPQRFPSMSIVVVIDKSGSMTAEEDGTPKIRLAGEAAARVAELITDRDEITVIPFDDRATDVIGPLPGSQRQDVIERLARLEAGGGGIWVREALETALEYLEDSEHDARHIILLADGSDSEHQQEVPELVTGEMADQEITLSTVAIGAGSDLAFLEGIAQLGGGRYHFTDRAANLPFIFAQETQLAMRSYVVEEPFFPNLVAPSAMLTDIEAVPQLTGYVATSAKPTAQVILSTHQEDPLLAAWQYGLGRAVAWTSDGTGRWAQRWVEWEGFARFWAQVVRWTVPRPSEVPLELSIEPAGEVAHVAVDALDEDGDPINGLETALSVVAPDGESTQIELRQIAPGHYEGSFAPEGEGAYLMRVTGAQPGREALGLTTGWTLGYSPEYAALEADPEYLDHLTDLGGGQVLEEPGGAFAHTLEGQGTTRELWPYLLAMAALLLPIDIGVRRLALNRRDLERAWAWLKARVPRPRARPQPESPSPVRRLFQAKERAERPTRPPSPAPLPLEEPTPPPSKPAPKEDEEETREGVDETLARRLLERKKEREGQDDSDT